MELELKTHESRHAKNRIYERTTNGEGIFAVGMEAQDVVQSISGLFRGTKAGGPFGAERPRLDQDLKRRELLGFEQWCKRYQEVVREVSRGGARRINTG